MYANAPLRIATASCDGRHGRRGQSGTVYGAINLGQDCYVDLHLRFRKPDWVGAPTGNVYRVSRVNSGTLENQAVVAVQVVW